MLVKTNDMLLYINVESYVLFQISLCHADKKMTKELFSIFGCCTFAAVCSFLRALLMLDILHLWGI